MLAKMYFYGNFWIIFKNILIYNTGKLAMRLINYFFLGGEAEILVKKEAVKHAWSPTNEPKKAPFRQNRFGRQDSNLAAIGQNFE